MLFHSINACLKKLNPFHLVWKTKCETVKQRQSVQHPHLIKIHWHIRWHFRIAWMTLRKQRLQALLAICRLGGDCPLLPVTDSWYSYSVLCSKIWSFIPWFWICPALFLVLDPTLSSQHPLHQYDLFSCPHRLFATLLFFRSPLAVLRRTLFSDILEQIRFGICSFIWQTLYWTNCHKGHCFCLLSWSFLILPPRMSLCFRFHPIRIAGDCCAHALLAAALALENQMTKTGIV